MNHFFGVEVPQEVQEYIEQEVVRFWKPALRENTLWYRPDDYHVTLKFLGDISEEQRQYLVSVAAPIAAQSRPFMLKLAAPGAFPSHRSKRVFWMGVGQEAALSGLAANLDNICHRLGFRREDRLYAPHITLARISRGGGRESVSNSPILGERTFPCWQVTRFVLMQTLPPDERANGAKARYNIVHTFPFGDTPL